MSDQTSIPVPDTPATLRPCAWCAAPSVGLVEVEPPRYRFDRGVRVVARRALEVPACGKHVNILSWQEQELPEPDIRHVYTPRNATDTQRQAAARAFPESGSKRKQILAAIWRSGHHGATRDELARRLSMSQNTVRPRVRELIEEGWVRPDGHTRPSDTGQPAEVLILTEAAEREINRRLQSAA